MNIMVNFVIKTVGFAIWTLGKLRFYHWSLLDLWEVSKGTNTISVQAAHGTSREFARTRSSTGAESSIDGCTAHLK